MITHSDDLWTCIQAVMRGSAVSYSGVHTDAWNEITQKMQQSSIRRSAYTVDERAAYIRELLSKDHNSYVTFDSVVDEAHFAANCTTQKAESLVSFTKEFFKPRIDVPVQADLKHKFGKVPDQKGFASSTAFSLSALNGIKGSK